MNTNAIKVRTVGRHLSILQILVVDINQQKAHGNLKLVQEIFSIIQLEIPIHFQIF
jgi:hypothetical protein